ncbi:Ca2+-binding RTX toxin-like protein [Microvirga lupini]|uniref:Ca2+-binding RTX toxin-like protein n=1 Tax=Microvirga lupini TaxID=420324 RepID=A0A7W4VQV7_9HYPH|nr:cadherin domain-containing protein [Microvirga lupini]MBB3021654.1 Ca2+-binding RTX toxin-like protein [Microvirga lupini]
MATYSIYNNTALSAEGFFPIGVTISQADIAGNGRDYTFTVGGETRIVRVYWNPDTLNIYAIGLYDADEESLGEILETSIPLTAFEAMWFDTAQSGAEVFAFIFSGNDQMDGNDAENTFVPGLGNDEVFGGGDNGINDYDYVNYAADNRQHGITVDLVDGDAEDDVGKVTSRGGAPETDILHSINGVYATRHDDHLIGDDRDNEFWAGLGNDTINSGGGFDVIGYNGPETRTKGIVVEFASDQAGTVVGEDGETDTFSEIEAVYGTQFGDRFTGAEGYQRFRGFAGNDTFDGGEGDDEVDYRNDTRQIDGAGIRVDLSQVEDDGSVLVQGVNGDTDRLFSIEYIRGSRDSDTITGSNGSNRLRGDAGDDGIKGLGGDDRLEGSAGSDTLNGGAGWDTLDGGVGDDVLIGGIGADTDEDYFVGGLGNDTIYGGEVAQDDKPDTNWNDLSYLDSGLSGITVTFADNANRYGSGTVVKPEGGGTDTFYNIHVVRGTNGNDTFIGGESSVSQRFVGYGGADTFVGSKGVNEVDYRAEYRAAPDELKKGMTIDLRGGDTVTVTDLFGDMDTLTRIERIRGTETDDDIFGNDLDNRLRGDNGDDRLTGEDGNDRLEGGAGWDSLDGGSGNDVLIGGVGADTDEDYFVGSTGNDTIYGGEVTEEDNPDTNWNDLGYGSGIFSSIEVVFTPGERYGTGTVVKRGDNGEIVGTDQFFNIHVVRGTSGADKFIGATSPAESPVPQRFIGLAGADVFDGTDGVNEVDYRADYRAAPANLKKGMTIDLSTGNTVTVADLFGDMDTLTRIERIRGTEAADRILGNNLHNRLRGDSGSDTLSGGAGDDTLDGGVGADTAVYSGARSNYHVANNGTTLTIADKVGGEGTDTVIDVEVFNFNGTVLNLAEVINHGSAINLAGGMVFENSKTGEDVGTLSVANPDALSTHTYTLINDAGGRFQLASDNKTIEVKNGLLLDYEQAMTHTVVVRATDQFGKSVDQTLTVVLKDIAKETTAGTSGGDTISGGSSTDNLSGGAGNDSLNGGGGKDKINGGTGNDRIIGGSGQDSLTGGSGKDIFVFANKDTGTSKGTADYITDFSGRGGDKIDLKLIDADVKKKGDQAFSFIGKNAFTKAGQVRYEKTGKDTYVYLNTDSDKAAEGVIKLKGAMDLQKGWFVL